MALLCFRVVLVSSFLIAAWRWGDLKNWQRYYPTVLFVMVINLSASFLSYHHSLWNYSNDAIITTETIVEFVNAYINLPATVLIYLSHFPANGALQKIIYGSFWVALFAALEFTDHYILGGIFYTNHWDWSYSVIFDVFMFSIIRVHYLNPWKGWLFSLLVAIFIIVQFGFLTGEMK